MEDYCETLTSIQKKLQGYLMEISVKCLTVNRNF